MIGSIGNFAKNAHSRLLEKAKKNKIWPVKFLKILSVSVLYQFYETKKTMLGPFSIH